MLSWGEEERLLIPDSGILNPDSFCGFLILEFGGVLGWVYLRNFQMKELNSEWLNQKCISAARIQA